MSGLYSTRLKIDKSQLTSAHRLRLEAGAASYMVKIYKYSGNGQSSSPDTKYGSFKPNGESDQSWPKYLNDSDSMGAHWTVYIDKVQLWEGNVKKVFAQKNTDWSVPNIKDFSVAPAKVDKGAPNQVETTITRYRVYRIHPLTALAVQLSAEELEEAKTKTKNDQLKEIEAGSYYIYRWKSLTKTSKNTIDRINGVLLIDNKYINKALVTLQGLVKTHAGKYPPTFFKTYSVAVFQAVLANTKKPDDDINGLADQLGVNVGQANDEAKAVYHVYEALVRKNSSDVWGGYDKVQHFIYSARSQYKNGPGSTNDRQYAGEAWDLATGDSIQESKDDMYANNSGQAYGAKLYAKYHPLRSWISNHDNP